MPVDAAGEDGRLGPEILRLAVETCPSGILVVGGDGRMVLVNGEIERMFGYRREELLGQSIEILLPEKFRGRHAFQRHSYAAHADSRRLGGGRDLTGRRKDGTEFPVEIGLNPCNLNGQLMVVSAIVDISERKRLERVHNEFISIVSHELRTPITSIGASLGLLLVGGAQNLPQPAVHLLKIAHSNCQRLVRLVNDILTVEKLAAGEMPFRFQRCDGRTLLETAIEANRGFAGSVGVRCEVPAEPFELYVDPDRFTQIIINLLSNAVKFSPPGGVVDVGAEKRGDHVRITVRDHGPGIPAEFRPRMFEKFAQAEAADGQKKGGTGLGLNIVREIVMHMHGQVGFEDAAGGGTVFYVDLPGADQAANWQSQVAPAPNLTRLPKTQRASSKRRASVTNQAS